MNRFGIRLAAGLAVITLGCLGIFQVQRGSETTVEEPWNDATAAAAIEPPTPLQLEKEAAAPLDLQTPVLGDPALGDPALGDPALGDPALGDPALGDPAQLVRGNHPGSAADAAASGPSSAFGFGAFDDPSAGPAARVAPAVGEAAAAAEQASAAAGPGAAGGIQLAAHDEPAAAGPASGFAFPQPLTAAAPAPEPAAPAAEAPLAADEAAPPASIPAGESIPAAAMPAGESPASDSGVTIAEIDDSPVGSSLQMPQPLSPAPAAELAQEAPSQEAPAQEAPSQEIPQQEAPQQELAVQDLPALEPLEPQSLEPLPSEAAAAAEPPAEQGTATAETEPAELTISGFQTGPPMQASDVAGEAVQPADNFAAAPAEGGDLNQEYSEAAAPQPMAAATAMQTVNLNEVLAEPGERRLEGAQTPSVVIHKRAPEEIRVGKPSDFIIQVKNVGTVAALDVRIFDSVPQGMRLVEVVPQAAEVDGLLCWQLGDLEPGGERTVTMKLIPEVEGELGSVARVTFEAAASVRTIATRPQLKLVQRAPEQVLIGQQLEIEVELSNVGSGTATGVILQADLPEGLDHPMGRQLDNLIGAMPPGDVRRQILRLRATAPGKIQNTIRLTGEDGVTVESTVDIEVVSPALEVALSGPSLRYLERQTTYNVQVANSGTANASEVDIVAYLDRGLKFVSTEFEGQYDPNQHAVFWSLAELPAGQSGEVPLTLLPVEAGTHNVRLEAKAALGIAAASEKELAIETLAELNFSIADNQDPIETGAETTYEVRVQNTGSRDDSNVQLKVQLPAGMELISADPQAGTDGRGLVVFQPIARIDSKGEQVFRVRVRGATADTHLIQAMLTSDQAPKPVTKEESTTVYADR